MSRQDKELQEEAERNSSDFRGSEESTLETIGAEFAPIQSLLKLETLACLRE